MAAAPLIMGLGTTDPTALQPQPTILSASKLNADGQTANNSASAVSNQCIGTIAIGALTNGAANSSTVTITNSLITANSYIFCQVARGTTTPAAGALAVVLAAPRVPTSGSCVVDVCNLGSAATLSTDYVLWYWIVN